jgi:mannose-6-phosphate isomerase-like protein (cupin superfamily)
MYRVLEGNVQFIVNGTQFCAKPGDYVYVQRPLKQTFRISNPTLKKKRVRMQLLCSFQVDLNTFLMIWPSYF